MPKEKIRENIVTLFEEVMRKRPVDLKGDYVASMYICSTMSPGIKINHKLLG